MGCVNKKAAHATLGQVYLETCIDLPSSYPGFADGPVIGTLAGGFHVRGRRRDGGGACGALEEGAALVPRRHVEGHQGYHAHRHVDLQKLKYII